MFDHFKRLLIIKLVQTNNKSKADKVQNGPRHVYDGDWNQNGHNSLCLKLLYIISHYFCA